MIARLSVRPGSDEVGDERYEYLSERKEIVEGGILLNHAMAGPFRVVANALHLTGS